MLYECGSLVRLNDLYRYPRFVSLMFAAPPSPELFTAVKTTDVQNKRMYRETQDHNSKQGEYMRSSDYYWFENLDGRTDDYRYPDILDIIEQEEKAKQKRKRGSKQKPRMNRENIRIRMAIGMYVTKEEFDYYRRTCTPQEREELECFYALHSGMSGFGIAGLYTPPSRGLNLGYSEGYTSTVVEMNGRRSLVMMPTSTPDINIEADSTRRVHTVLDLPFFMLQLMAGVPSYNFIDRTSSWLRKEQDGQYDGMELIAEMEKQDEKLTAYVMMEEGTFCNECERMFERTGNDRSPRALMWMLGILTKIYGASMQMTKIRMKEIGITEVEGIWNFIGNKERVPDHAASGGWYSNVIYTIDRQDAIALISSSERFASVLLSGRYVYLEGHYVLNDPRYIETAPNGMQRLTEYAHAHIDECCLAFRPKRRKITFQYASGSAARTKKNGNGKYNTVELVSEPGEEGYQAENNAFSESAARWGALAGALHGTFHDALQMVLDELGVSQTTLASHMGVSRQAFQKWLKREIMLKRHVVGICISLKLDIGVSLRLIELAGLHLSYYGADPIYLHLLSDRNMTIERGNDILTEQGFKKLNDGRHFELDMLDFDSQTQSQLRRRYGIEEE